MRKKEKQEKRIFHPHSQEELLKGWLVHCHKERDRHSEAARVYDQYNQWLGGSAAILSAIVATSVFASVSQDARNLTIGIIVGMLSVLATILAALTTFYKFAERAERHRATAAKHKVNIRELECILSGIDENIEDFPTIRCEMQKKLDDLEVDSPVVSQRLYDRIQKRFPKVQFCETIEGTIEGCSGAHNVDQNHQA